LGAEAADIAPCDSVSALRTVPTASSFEYQAASQAQPVAVLRDTFGATPGLRSLFTFSPSCAAGRAHQQYGHRCCAHDTFGIAAEHQASYSAPAMGAEND
jgi:hypothetical protein